MNDVTTEVQNLVEFLNTFRCKSTDELSDYTGFYTQSKSKNALLIRRMEEGFKGRKFFETLSEVNNLCTKTIQLLENGSVKEAMSFPMFSYESIAHETWETSETKKAFSKTFLLCVFRRDGEENIFCGAFLWRMPSDVLDGEVKKVWEKTREIVVSGNVVKQDGKRIILNFPREGESSVCHVRPHGRNALDLAKLPKKDVTTSYIGLPKQSFWLNHSYLNKIVQEHGSIDDGILYNVK